MRLILWDFDGTLATRDGGWEGTILQFPKDSGMASLNMGIDDVRPHLRTGFPWPDPSTPHLQIQDAEQWWTWMAPYFERVFRNLGCDSGEARYCTNLVRSTYLDFSFWRAFDDVEVLRALGQLGWTHWIVSNHIPELEDIVNRLGLSAHVTRVYTSGLTGYEKPHPLAYKAALDRAISLEAVWMVGDNFVADYEGPRLSGVPSILVRNNVKGAALNAHDLWEVAAIIESEEQKT